MAWLYPRYANRSEAGKRLAESLSDYAGRDNTLVLALPRGGVPVAFEVAKALSLPMDIWIVRKLGVPGHEELAMGALAGGDVSFLNHDLIKALLIDQAAINDVIARETAELQRRNELYRNGGPTPDVTGKTVIVVDDGLATGATMRAAISSLRQAGAAGIVVAVPVCAASTQMELKEEADDVICHLTPEPFYGVGMWYEDFSQTTDEEVQNLLTQALEMPRKRGTEFRPADDRPG